MFSFLNSSWKHFVFSELYEELLSGSSLASAFERPIWLKQKHITPLFLFSHIDCPGRNFLPVCRGERWHQDSCKEILWSETFLFMSSGNKEIVEQEPEQLYMHGLHCCFKGLHKAFQCQCQYDNSSALITLGQVAPAGLGPCHKYRAWRSGLDRTLSGMEGPLTWAGLFLEKRTVV